MGHKYSKDELLRAAFDVAVDDGLSGMSFGGLAKRLGVSDRVLVYYFPTKHELVAEILDTMAARLREALAAAFTTRAKDHVELVATAWPVLATPGADPVFRLFFEALGLAAAGAEPYERVASELVQEWSAWLEQFVQGRAEHRRAEAVAAIAVLDGLLLLRQLSGPEVAERAATRILRRRGGGPITPT